MLLSILKDHKIVPICCLNLSHIRAELLKVDYVLQALLGCLLFGEALTMRWWLGTSLILTGLILIHYNSVPVTKEHPEVKKE